MSPVTCQLSILLLGQSVWTITLLTFRQHSGLLLRDREFIIDVIDFREREEEWDSVTYKVFWDMATNNPESGICKMPSVDYYSRSLREAGVIREGQTEIWYKDLVHDVLSRPSLFLINSSGYSLLKNYPRGRNAESV
jgi:hypothetical protein